MHVVCTEIDVCVFAHRRNDVTVAAAAAARGGYIDSHALVYIGLSLCLCALCSELPTTIVVMLVVAAACPSPRLLSSSSIAKLCFGCHRARPFRARDNRPIECRAASFAKHSEIANE